MATIAADRCRRRRRGVKRNDRRARHGSANSSLRRCRRCRSWPGATADPARQLDAGGGGDRARVKPLFGRDPTRSACDAHQRGCACRMLRAAAAAARAEANSPKQVAPEPDMRASRQPGACATPRAPARSPAASLMAAGSRSLRLPRRGTRRRPSPSRGSAARSRGTLALAAGLEAEHREHILGRHRDARIDQHRRELRHRQRLGQHFADAAHPRAGADRGRPARRRRSGARPLAAARSSSASRLARASRRSAAAASDEPPPSPAATGSRLSSVKRPSFRPGDFGRERARGLEHQIVVDRRRPARRVGPRTVERERRARRQASAGRRRRRTPPGFRARDSRRRGGRARAA